MNVVEYIKAFPIKSFTKNEVLLNAGETCDRLFAIREGFAKISSLDDYGNQKLLWVVGRYDIVPLENLFQSGQAHYFYTALSNGSMYVIDKKALLNETDKSPVLMGQIARGLSEHYDDLLSRMNGVEQSNIRSKIMYTLLNLANKFGASEAVDLNEIGLNITHQDIADMIGATRETTSVELKRLSDSGMIKYSRSSFEVFTDKISSEIKEYLD